MNKASGGDGIPAELFQILKDDAIKVLHLLCQQIWKTQQWPQDWKRSVFIPVPKKGNAKECSNYHTIALISYAIKVKTQNISSWPLIVCELRTSRCSQKSQRNERSNCQQPLDHRKKAREFQKSFCFIDYDKTFDSVDHNKLWEILKEMGIPDNLTCLLRNLYAGQEETELNMEQWTRPKLGKEYIKTAYCHLAYLIYMNSTSCEMPD